MKIEYNYTAECLEAFHKFDSWYSDERKLFRIKTRIYWALIATIPFWLVVFNLDNVNSTLGLAFYGLFLFCLGFFGAKRLHLSKIEAITRRMVVDKTNEDFFGPTTIEFSGTSIQWATRDSKGESTIRSIKKIKADKDYYYLYNSSLTAFVIPKTALKSPDDLEYFRTIFRPVWPKMNDE